MIYIRKKKEPEAVENWKKKFKNMHNRLPQYDDIQNVKEKIILKEALMQEQKYVCCYCCTRLTMKKSHIEHFRPKNKEEYMHLSLDYGNLFASCQGEKQLGNNCGHAKKNQFDENLMISPLDENCEQHFVYQIDGMIEPADPEDEAAKYTIHVLALDEKRLCRARETALWESGIFTDSEDEKHQMLVKFDDPNVCELPPYWDAIRYFLLKEDNSGEV